MIIKTTDNGPKCLLTSLSIISRNCNRWQGCQLCAGSAAHSGPTHCLDMQRIRLHIKRTIVCSQVVGGNGPRAHEINLDNNVKRRHVANWENSEDLQIASCFFKQQFFFCCIIIKKRESHRLKILMLPFSPLHHLYSPQLTRMAFETVIKCLRSTRPLHYSWVPIDHILLPLCCGDHCNILNPPKQIGDLTEIKKITILAIDQRKSFCLILNPAFETKLDDVRESLIGKMQKKKIQ